MPALPATDSYSLGRAAPLLMPPADASPESWIPQRVAAMAHDDNNNNLLQQQQQLLLQSYSSSDWDCDGCAPPVFDLPPPPRPPWLEDLDGCEDDDESSPSSYTRSQLLAQLETCDNTVIHDSFHYFEDTFHTVSVILVCSVVLVILLLFVGFVVFKRRKGYHRHTNGHLHRHHHHRPSDTMVNSAGVPAGQRHSKQLYYQQQQHWPDSQGNTSKRGGTSSTNVPDQRLPNSLPNHYIPDSDKQWAQRPPAPAPGTFHYPLSERSSNVLQLSDRPPELQSTPAHIYHNYPHLIIGGQPFYLIPTNPEGALESESYAYPQCVPIYEEIDPNHSDNEEDEASSDRCELGSGLHLNTLGGAVAPRPQQPRVLVNPLVRDVLFQNGVDETSRHFAPIGSDGQGTLPTRLAPRPSPPLSSATSRTSSSVYYYSDTLRKPEGGGGVDTSSSSSDTKEKTKTRAGPDIDDSSDSGISNHVLQPATSSPSSSDLAPEKCPVDTEVVVLSDPDIDKTNDNSSSTLV